MNDYFEIFCCRQWMEHDVESSTDVLWDLLANLSTIHPLLSDWSVWYVCRGGFQRVPVKTKADIHAGLLEGRNFTELAPKVPIPRLGFHIDFLNKGRRGVYIRLSVQIGTHVKGLFNVTILQQLSASQSKTLVSPKVMRATLIALVKAFEPETAYVDSFLYRSRVDKEDEGYEHTPFHHLAGWMTYFSDTSEVASVRHDDFDSERIDNKGTLVYACKETLDVNNPLHLQALETLRERFVAKIQAAKLAAAAKPRAKRKPKKK